MKLNKLIRIGDIVIHEFLYAELVEDNDLRTELENTLKAKNEEIQKYPLVSGGNFDLQWNDVIKLETRLRNKEYSTLVRFHFSNGTFKDSFWFDTYEEAWGYLESLFDKEV